MKSDQVLLVDKNNNDLGVLDKFEAHLGEGRLHRAVSVIIYRDNDGKTEILLQKRSQFKPLWPLYWSNTICTHPRPGEPDTDCAVRRLREELGIKVNPESLQKLFQFTYQARYDEKLSENEFDTLFVCKWSGKVTKDSKEVVAYKWITIEDLTRHINNNPNIYTPWFHKVVVSTEFINYFKILTNS